MSSRVDLFFRQKVTEAELDLAFDMLEKADRDLAADVGIHGIISGGVPAPHTPVPDLTIDLTAPARAYDHLGQRVFFGTGQTVDCGVDLVGIPTDVATAGNERWLGVFLRFKRLLSDPRTDGNSQQVFFRRDESFEVVVRQAPEGAVGVAPKPALQDDELLLCDVRRRPGQTQILAADIDTTRRQAFVFVQGTSVAIDPGTWNILAPLAPTVQGSLDAVDAELRDHFTATGRRHAAAAVTYTPHGFVAAGNVQGAIDEVVDDLGAGTAGTSGAIRIGADATSGAPNALAAGTVKSQLSALLGFLNAHANASNGAHNASAVAATAHNHITTTNVQAQLQEIVTDLLATGAGSPGAGLVGIDAIAGAPTAIGAGTLRAAFATLLAGVNGHVGQADGAHAASAISVADAGDNLNAANVEAALAEIVEAIGDDHFRGNEINAGQHRSIRQPPLGGTKALILDSNASGVAATHLRIYADSLWAWLTLNASWDGTRWVRDSTSLVSSAIRLSRLDVAFLLENSSAATFTDWTSSWRLPMAQSVNSAFEVTGAVSETGVFGMQWTNASSTSRSCAGGGGATFRSRFPTVPSSITLSSRHSNNGFTGAPTVAYIDGDGFGFFSFQTLAAGATAFWFGWYTVIA